MLHFIFQLSFKKSMYKHKYIYFTQHNSYQQLSLYWEEIIL